jgi:zinc protease
MTPQTVDAQRDVVKNERRQSVENRPYGTGRGCDSRRDVVSRGPSVSLAGHRVHAGLTAASYEDVVAFFKKFYSPANASLVIAGDIDVANTRRLVDKWFGDVKPGAPAEPPSIPGVALNGVQKKTVTDRVQLPRLFLAWLTPRHLEPGDAALDVVADVLTGGKNSRLYKRLVYDLQIAQNVRRRRIRRRCRRTSKSR